MKLKVYNLEGKASGRSVTIDDAIAKQEPNDHVMWLDVRRIQAHNRQGTHKAKERGETRGSTRKLYRQKGTGSARAGSAKSPVRRSGGTIFGPRPHKYRLKINRKTKKLARRSAFATKAQAKEIRVIEDFSYDEPDTNGLQALLDANDLTGTKVLMLTNGNQAEINQSGRNIPEVVVREASSASTLDILNAGVVLIQEGAVESISNMYT